MERQQKETFALSREGYPGVDLWCENRGLDADGGQRFWVINGLWSGVIKDGWATTDRYGDGWPATEVWRGHVPLSAYQIVDDGTGRDYNAAIHWIETQL